jgi:hypothetical protein
MNRYLKRNRIQKIKHDLASIALLVAVGITGCMWAYAYSSQALHNMQKQNKYLVR